MIRDARDLPKVNAAIEAARSALARMPAFPKVVGEFFELREDQSDDPAVFLTVLLDDATSDTDWVDEKLDPISDQFRQALAAAEVERWVYTRFLRPQDLKEAG